MALERIILNIIPAGDMPVFHCSQYENGRSVIIDLVSSDDDAYIVPEGVTVELHCRKCDDTIITMEPDEVDNNTVTFVTSEQLTACPGDNLCELVLYSGTDPVQTLGTLNFILHVEPDPLAGGLTSESEIYNLTQQIEDIAQEVIGEDYYNKTETDALLANKANSNSVYTKGETDTLLSAKANTADLATVATTGDYDDLLNKPVIPVQVQSDYAQEDSTQVDYIKNKPDIDAMIAAALLAVMPVGTESGPIASFDTEIAAPLVNVSCDIVATGGNGTPDNPNPISGYTEANITRCGVNIWNEEWKIITQSGRDWITNKNPIPVQPNHTYYISTPFNASIDNVSLTGSYISYIGQKGNEAFTTPSNCHYIRFLVDTNNYGTTYNNDISINYPSTDTTYHPYTGNTYTVNFGQTVYGGVLDATRGKLTDTFDDSNLSDITGWSYGNGFFRTLALKDIIKKPTSQTVATNALCSIYKSVSWNSCGDNDFEFAFNAVNGELIIKDSRYTDVPTFLAGVSSIPLVYELATPFEIDLTPEVISAVVGTNNVYSDTNGDTTVQYKDSIQHYIDTRV